MVSCKQNLGRRYAAVPASPLFAKTLIDIRFRQVRYRIDEYLSSGGHGDRYRCATKIQMAEAVLDRATAVIDTEILGMARAPGSLKTRIQKIIAVLNHMYAGGRTPCVLGQLASSQLGPDGRQGLRTAFSHWIEAIAILAHESGMPPTHAKNFAEDWVASVQGALILQAATADAGAFVRSMDALMALTKKSARGSV